MPVRHRCAKTRQEPQVNIMVYENLTMAAFVLSLHASDHRGVGPVKGTKICQ